MTSQRISNSFAGNGLAALAVIAASTGIAIGQSMASASSGSVGIASGANHSCLKQANGEVTCWGAGANGQLGNRAYADSSEPVKVDGLTGATAVALGKRHSCALLKLGTVSCWGANEHGQLGDGTTDDSSVPRPVAGLTNVKAIAAGGNSTCVILGSDNKVKCWGAGNRGQLGNTHAADSSTPVEVHSLSGAIAVALAEDAACAALDDGKKVMCWGSNSNGQLATGDASTSSSKTPLAVRGLLSNSTNPSKSVSESFDTNLSSLPVISAGDQHFCAVIDRKTITLLKGKATRTVTTNVAKCWGLGEKGQLGFGGTADHRKPTLVAHLAGIKRLVAGGDHTCATLTKGSLLCWGDGTWGQAGNGRTLTQALSPEPINARAAVVDLALGVDHTCAVLANQSASCWGSNTYGQLGLTPNCPGGKPSDDAVACTAPVSPNGGVVDGGTAIAVGGSHACEVNAAKVRCWGDNRQGQLGTGKGTAPTLPTAVALASTSAASLVAAGTSHTCVLLGDTKVECWGLNRQGQLGNGNFKNALSPSPVIGVLARDLAAGGSETCAITSADRKVVCWGANDHGQLGNGKTADSEVPVEVERIMGAIKIAVGVGSACAIDAGGKVQCWGSNNHGQLGDETTVTSSVPVEVKGVTSAIDVAVGNGFACAITTGKRIKCWGDNENGQLGNASTLESLTAVEVGSVSVATQISAADSTVCAVAFEATKQLIKCWGGNSHGQLGNGATSNSPVATSLVGVADGAIEVRTGGTTGCARLTGNVVKCWGANDHMQLGRTTRLFASIAGVERVALRTAVVTLVGFPRADGDRAPLRGKAALTGAKIRVAGNGAKVAACTLTAGRKAVTLPVKQCAGLGNGTHPFSLAGGLPDAGDTFNLTVRIADDTFGTYYKRATWTYGWNWYLQVLNGERGCKFYRAPTWKFIPYKGRIKKLFKVSVRGTWATITAKPGSEFRVKTVRCRIDKPGAYSK